MRFLDQKLGDLFPTLDRVFSPGHREESLHLVQRGVKAKESEDFPDLSTQNHAFYLGAVSVPSFPERSIGLLRTPDRSIYDEEHLLGLLSELALLGENAADLNLKVVPQVDYFFNGREKEKPDLPRVCDYLRSLAKRHFGAPFAQKLNVIDPSQEERHSLLFKNLDQADDPYSVFESTEECPDTSSLAIAKQLFLAAQGNERFRKSLRKTTPTRLKQKMPKEESFINGYALTELAIRITDLLAGQVLQGGMDRQEIYDDIIADIVKGKTGPYSRCPALVPLFEKLKDTAFSSIYYQAPNEYEQHVVRSRAGVRLGVQVAMMGLVAGGVYARGKFDERQGWEEKETHIADEIISCAAEVPFRQCDSDNWCRNNAVDPGRRYKVLEKITDKGIEWMGVRYDLKPSSVLDELEIKSLWVDHLCSLKDYSLSSLGTEYEVNPSLSAEVDNFVTHHAAFFGARGVNVSRPNADLAQNMDIFERASRSTEDSTVPCDGQFKLLGEYTPPSSFKGPYKFFIEMTEGEPRLWVEDHVWRQDTEVRECLLSTKLATKAAQYFLADQYRFDAHSLDALYSAGLLFEPFGQTPQSVAIDAGGLSLESTFFKSPEGESYEVKRFHYSDYDNGLSKDYAVARVQGEDLFSVHRATELENIYVDLVLQRPVVFPN